MMHNTACKILRFLSWYLMPAILLIFIAIDLHNPHDFMGLTAEDHFVEWATFAFLFLSGVLSLCMAALQRQRSGKHRIFFLIFGLFCIAMAGEEISWGQRVFGIASPEFFVEHSDQQEINLHNILQQVMHIKTKHVAGIMLFLYGACMPFLIRKNARIRMLADKSGILFPPWVLSISFLIASLLMIDHPTGHEEELGEWFFGICFFLFLMMELFDCHQSRNST